MDIVVMYLLQCSGAGILAGLPAAPVQAGHSALPGNQCRLDGWTAMQAKTMSNFCRFSVVDRSNHPKRHLKPKTL
jgi:hypothetical protein